MYCTIQDMNDDLTEKIAAQLSNDNDPTVINETLLGKYIADAGEFINGFLRSRYLLPLLNEHSIIKKVCIDIVKYELYKRRGKVYDSVQGLYKDAVAVLEKIQKGMITLEEGNPESRPGFYLVSERKPVISKKALDNYL